MKIPDLKELASRIHMRNVKAGWWDDCDDDAFVVTKKMLVISELSEAMEGHRKDLMDDHLTDLPMFDVELADAAIRILDLVMGTGGAAHLTLCEHAHEFVESVGEAVTPVVLYECCKYVTEGRMDRALALIITIAIIRDIDLFAIIDRKVEYNRTRADHQRAARAATNGKKY